MIFFSLSCLRLWCSLKTTSWFSPASYTALLEQTLSAARTSSSFEGTPLTEKDKNYNYKSICLSFPFCFFFQLMHLINFFNSAVSFPIRNNLNFRWKQRLNDIFKVDGFFLKDTYSQRHALIFRFGALSIQSW